MDLTGNGYHMRNGYALGSDSDDVWWTDRGAFMYHKDGLYLATTDIHPTGFLLPTTFSVMIWMRPNQEDIHLLKKGSNFETQLKPHKELECKIYGQNAGDIDLDSYSMDYRGKF